MRDALKRMMQATGKTKFKTELFSFGIQKNPPSVNITGDVPEEYLIPQPSKPDKTRISKELKAGACFDWAALEQTESLRIR